MSDKPSRKGLQRQVKEDVVALANEVVGRMRLDLDAMENRADVAEAALSEAKQLEFAIRQKCWLSHGHNLLYGDDGEMQCSKCASWNYKNAPLLDTVNSAFLTLHEQLRIANEENAELRKNYLMVFEQGSKRAERNRELQTELNAANKDNAKLREQLTKAFDDGYRHADESLRGEVAQLQTTNSELKAELKRVEGFLDVERSNHRVSIMQWSKDETAVEQLQTTISTLTQERDEANKVIRQLTHECCPFEALNKELIAALDGLMGAYGAHDGRNGNSGECWDRARAVYAAVHAEEKP